MKRIAAWFMSALLLAVSLTGCSAGKTETENRGKSYFTYFDTVSFVYSYAGDSAEQFDRRSAGASGILGEYHRLFSRVYITSIYVIYIVAFKLESAAYLADFLFVHSSSVLCRLRNYPHI